MSKPTPVDEAKDKIRVDNIKAEQNNIFLSTGKYKVSDKLKANEKHKDRDVDVVAYEGVQGVGYELITRITKDSERWEKRENFGPETYRSKDWVLI